jgi:hypothetical protein
VPSGFNGLRTVLFTSARAEPVSLTLGAGPAVEIRAVRYDRPTDPVFDASTFRRVRFEVQAADIAGTPAKGDTIEDEAGTQWTVIEILEQPETASWMLTVETDG